MFSMLYFVSYSVIIDDVKDDEFANKIWGSPKKEKHFDER